MSDQGSKDKGGSVSGSAIQKPVACAPGPDTVVNPERRVRAAAALQEQLTGASGIWKRLFPAESDSLQRAGETPSGVALGHFVIEERIGVGGMGGVFRALDTRLQRIVALKVLSPTQAGDPAAVQRFQNEGRAAARLDHDNIARVYYIGEENGLSFIAFEFVTGTNVRDLMRDRGRLEPAEAVNYTLQVASALRHTSAAGVIHRDIKPSNIIITPSGRAKLVDLGLARKIGPQSAEELTVAGTTLGTFDYISPEQARDPRNVDVRSDIYSLGCTLYHMLTGEPPYPEGTVLQKLLNHQGKEPPDPARKCPAVSASLSAIVRKMMASDPKDRYASPELLIHDLMLIAGTLGLQGVHPEGLVWVSPKVLKRRFWERHAGWLATAGLLVLIVLILERFPQIGGGIPEDDARPTSLVSASSVPEGARDAATTTDSIASTATATPQAKDQLPQQPETVGSRETSADRETQTPVATRTEGTSPLPATSSNDGSEGTTRAPTVVTLTKPEQVFGTNMERQPVAPDIDVPKPSVSAEVAVSRPTDEGPMGAVLPIAPPADVIRGSEPETTQVRPSEAAAGTADDQPPVWVIDPTGSLIKKYPTVEAACAEVQDGRIIELRFNGRRREKPIRINNKNVTLRAARGYRPVIEFVPPEVLADAERLKMLSVVGGRLELNSLSLQFSVPPTSQADEFTVFSAEQSAHIRLRGVTITVENAEHHRASIFEFTRNTVERDPMMGTATVGETPVFEMTDCFLRGEADLCIVRQAASLRWSLQNTAVAVDGSLLRSIGGSGMMEPSDSASVELRLEHVTCLLGRHLLEMDAGSVPRVSVAARNSIFKANGSEALIRTQGDLSDDRYRELLTWSEERNYFDRYQVFWVFASGTEITTLDRWRDLWGLSQSVGPNNDGVGWRKREYHGKFWQTRRADLELDPIFSMSAVATDGSDVGADLSRIPPLPDE